MKLAHRTAHRLIWPVLIVAIGVGFTMALALRPPVPVETDTSDAVRP